MKTQIEAPLPNSHSPRIRRRACGGDDLLHGTWPKLVFQKRDSDIKAKLESVADGLVRFEEEFLSHIIIPGSEGETIGDWIGPQIAAAYDRGSVMPPLLEAPRP